MLVNPSHRISTISGDFLRQDGTTPLTADWSVGSFNIKDLLDPVDPQDAATKAYVDSVAAPTYTAGNGIILTGFSFAADYGVGLSSTIQPDDSAGNGVSNKLSRADHKHAIVAAAPATVNALTNAEGASTSFARADHAHRLELNIFSAGSAIGSRPRLNFIGATVADNPGSDRVDVTFAGGSPYLAGTGLTLTVDTFSVNYGTTAGTALEGTNDALYVKLAGAQTITGVKTFNANVQMSTSRKIIGVAELTLEAQGAGNRVDVAAGGAVRFRVADTGAVDVGLAGATPSSTPGLWVGNNRDIGSITASLSAYVRGYRFNVSDAHEFASMTYDAYYFGNTAYLDYATLGVFSKAGVEKARINEGLSIGTSTDPGAGKVLASSALGVGTVAPVASAALDLVSTTKGALLPRLTTTQRNAVASPALSLLIFNTTAARFEFWDGAAWQPLVGGGGTYYAGTGLTLSGGDTFNVTYGTTAGTALEGSADAGLVHKAGAETITGDKTFNANIIQGSGNTIAGVQELGLWAKDTTNIGSRLQLVVGISPTVIPVYVSRYSVSIGTNEQLANTVAAGILLPKTASVDEGIAFESDDGTLKMPAMSKRFALNPFSATNEDVIVVGSAEANPQNLKLAGYNYVELRVNENAEGGVYLKTGGNFQWDKCALEFSQFVISPPNPVNLGATDPVFLVGCDTTGAVGTISLPDPVTTDILPGRAYVIYDYGDNASVNNITIAAAGVGVTVDGAASVTITANRGAKLIILSTTLEWTTIDLGSTGGGSPYALPFFLVGPAGSGPGGSSPQYATLAAAKAAMTAGAHQVAILMPGTYVEDLTIDTVAMSVVAWAPHASVDATALVTVEGTVTINPNAANRNIALTGFRVKAAAGQGVVVTGANAVFVDTTGIRVTASDEALLVSNTSASTKVVGDNCSFVSTLKEGMKFGGAAHNHDFKSTGVSGPAAAGAVRTNDGAKVTFHDGGSIVNNVFANGAGSLITLRTGVTHVTGANVPYIVGASGSLIVEGVRLDSSATKLVQDNGAGGFFAFCDLKISGGVPFTYDAGVVIVVIPFLPGAVYQVMTVTGAINEYADYVFLGSTGKITASLPNGMNRLARPITIYALDAPIIGTAHDVAVTGGGTVNGAATRAVAASYAITVVPGILANEWFVVGDSQGSGASTTPTFAPLLHGVKVTTPADTSEAVIGGGTWTASDHTGATARLRVTGASTDGTNAVQVRLYKLVANVWTALTNLNGANNFLSITDAEGENKTSDNIYAQLTDGDILQLRVTPTNAATQAVMYRGTIAVTP